jgi:hypothetical protein
VNIPGLKEGIDKPKVNKSLRTVPVINAGIDTGKIDLIINEPDIDDDNEFNTIIKGKIGGNEQEDKPDKPTINEPQIKEGIDVDAPNVDAPEIENLPTNKPNLNEGIDVDPIKKPNYLLNISEEPIENEINLNKREIPKPKIIDVDIPQPKPIDNSNPETNINIPDPSLTLSFPINDNNSSPFELKGIIEGQNPEVDQIDNSTKDINLNLPELSLNAPSLDMEKPELKGTNIKDEIKVEEPQIELNNPEMKNIIMKGTIEGVLPETETNPNINVDDVPEIKADTDIAFLPVNKPKRFIDMIELPVEDELDLDKIEVPKPNEIDVEIPKDLSDKHILSSNDDLNNPEINLCLPQINAPSIHKNVNKNDPQTIMTGIIGGNIFDENKDDNELIQPKLQGPDMNGEFKLNPLILDIHSPELKINNETDLLGSNCINEVPETISNISHLNHPSMKGIIEGTIPNEELKIKDSYDINNPPFIQTNPLDEVDLYKSQQESMKGIIGGNVYEPKQQPSNINEDTISRSSKIPIEFESCNLNYLQLMVEEPVENVVKILSFWCKSFKLISSVLTFKSIIGFLELLIIPSIYTFLDIEV